MHRLPASVLAILISLSGHEQGNAQEQPVKLWAAMSVSQPVFTASETGKLQIYFAVVNDTPVTVNPSVESSHLFVNGVELEGWNIIIGNGIRTTLFEALPPGNVLLFTYALGNLFQKAGIYTVRWEGKNYTTPDLVFRVMPKGV